MTKYVIEYRASGEIRVEADTAEEATVEALDKFLDLEHLDLDLAVHRVEQVKTYEAS